MKMNAQIVIYLALFATICFVSSFANPASLEDRLQSNIHHKSKRSPYLRLDELSTKIYLAKNKLGGGLIDPLEIGKRSTANEDTEMQLAIVLYDGIAECLNRDKCSHALKILLDN